MVLSHKFSTKINCLSVSQSIAHGRHWAEILLKSVSCPLRASRRGRQDSGRCTHTKANGWWHSSGIYNDRRDGVTVYGHSLKEFGLIILQRHTWGNMRGTYTIMKSAGRVGTVLFTNPKALNSGDISWFEGETFRTNERQSDFKTVAVSRGDMDERTHCLKKGSHRGCHQYDVPKGSLGCSSRIVAKAPTTPGFWIELSVAQAHFFGGLTRVRKMDKEGIIRPTCVTENGSSEKLLICSVFAAQRALLQFHPRVNTSYSGQWRHLRTAHSDSATFIWTTRIQDDLEQELFRTRGSPAIQRTKYPTHKPLGFSH